MFKQALKKQSMLKESRVKKKSIFWKSIFDGENVSRDVQRVEH